MRCNNCIHYDVCYQYDIIGEDDSEMCALYEQKRPSGEWIFKVVFPSGYWECSICKKGRLIVRENFCPKCGALMISSNSEIEKSKSEINPCIECCKIDNSEPCRKGCSEYKKWKEGERK